MRRGKIWAVSAALLAVGCSSSEPLKDMVGYVPPTSLPAQPKRTLVADPKEQVWSELLSFLESSDFEIDHVDRDENLIVARYSGDPEPYIDCGSIVTHQGGTLGQIAGSATSVALNYAIDDSPVILNRNLNLDSRIIITVAAQAQGTVIQTDTTYVVTKVVDVADPSGAVREGSRETVSFQAGNRGEFSKGTACQPNGSLHLAVLQSLPNVVGSDDIDRAELESDDIPAVAQASVEEEALASLSGPAEATTTEQPSLETTEVETTAPEQPTATLPGPSLEDDGDYDWVLPDQGLPTAALPRSELPSPSFDPPQAERETTSAATQASRPPAANEALAGTAPTPLDPDVADGAVTQDETIAALPAAPATEPVITDTGESDSIVDDTTRKLLQSLDCGGDEWHFCDLVEITTPYRKRNIEKLFGLTINTTESFTSQVVGRDLKLDILFPRFPSHLHIAYARRDGTVEHIMSSSDIWPADLSHQLATSGQTIPGPAGLAMIVAVASDEPLFSSPPDGAEDATVYLDRLKQRLAELETADPDGQVAASQLLIYVENAGT